MFMNDVPSSADLPTIIKNELRDIYGIKYRKDKKMKNTQLVGNHKIFNVPLKDLENTEVTLFSGNMCRVPKFVTDACSLLMDNVEVEGLFRKAGSTARQKEIREKIESGIPFDFTCNAIDVANILKYFFRELPEPLLPPNNFQESILRCLLCKGTHERKVSAIKMVCLLLPVINLNTLVYFMQFLNFVSTHSSMNKMSIKNLAIILTPSLMPITENIGQRLVSHVQIIEILIEHAHEIGFVPDNLLGQIQNIILSESMHDPHNFTIVSGTSTRKSMNSNHLEVPYTDAKKKKKRRSGSLTRMFNGLRKIVGAIGSTENLEEVHELDKLSTPCLTKSKKRKVLEASAFTTKKKKDVLALLPTGGMLPSTPMFTKSVKKSRLSLGGKRAANTAAPAKLSTATVPSLERRWSAIGSSWNRKRDKYHQTTVQDLSSSMSGQSTSSSSVVNNPQEENLLEQCITDIEQNNDLVRMTKSEYEEIKGRVSAIESRISKEFTKLQSSLLNNSLDSVDMVNQFNGPEKVREHFERTIEETEMMNSTPTTEKLAKHLSRGLKIRRSDENKVFRSPSARKISNIRRRSQENVRLSRNKSWNLGEAINYKANEQNNTRLFGVPLQSSLIITGPHDQTQKGSLKRGRPNTLQSGLRQVHQSPTSKTNENNTHKFSITNYPKEDIHQPEQVRNETSSDARFNNEKWICADVFFDDNNFTTNETENCLNASKVSTNSAKTRPNRKRLNMDDSPMDISPPPNATPRSANNVSILETMKTPMLPPRLPVIKRTPGSLIKTPNLPLSTFVSRSHLTPLWQQEQQQMGGRASIARLRSQNAGMVMAKAKLFDDLVVEPKVAKKQKQILKRENQRFLTTGTHQTLFAPNATQAQKNKDILETSLRSKITNASRKPGASTPHRNGIHNNKNSPSSAQRRQNLRSSRQIPIRKSPAAVINGVLSLSDNNNRIHRNSSTASHDGIMQSPMHRRAAALDATPHIKRALMNRHPRRIVRTSQGKRKATQ